MMGDSGRARAKRRKRKRKGDVRTNYSFDGLIEIRETAMGNGIYLVRARRKIRGGGVIILLFGGRIERGRNSSELGGKGAEKLGGERIGGRLFPPSRQCTDNR